MISNRVGSIFLISILILGFQINPIIFQKSDKNYASIDSHLNSQTGSLFGEAFAESNNASNNSSSEHSTESDQTKNEQQSKGNNTQINEENNQTYSEHQGENETEHLGENEHQSEYNQQSSNENNQNKTEGENQPQANQEGIDEINNENNNENATHQENQQDANNVENAIENKTVAAEVNIGQGNEETKSIDSNIDVHTNSTSDAVSVTVDSKTESGPKVMVFNLNSTTIDVSNVKYLHVTYDGHPIAPATDVNAVLHPKSTDEPSYAILITQHGAQIIVSIPHFSTHTITLSNISKVILPVPEFPIPVYVLIVALISIVIFSKVSIRGKN
ncbi:MAG: hypothetical protein KGI27_05090 [Thaumarchaeota archaeon]|nr:hypothetical protein [Nitrososphaerota archaeon]